jgi:hypothetical protein
MAERAPIDPGAFGVKSLPAGLRICRKRVLSEKCEADALLRAGPFPKLVSPPIIGPPLFRKRRKGKQ